MSQRVFWMFLVMVFVLGPVSLKGSGSNPMAAQVKTKNLSAKSDQNKVKTPPLSSVKKAKPSPWIMNLKQSSGGAPSIGTTAGGGSSPAGGGQGGVLLDMEGVGDNVPIEDFYAHLGIDFASNFLSIIDSDFGGSGNFGNNPSGVAIAYWLDGGSSIINVSNGFTDELSTYYASDAYASGGSAGIEIWSDIDATGSLLGTLDLPDTPNPYEVWEFVKIEFQGTAKSIKFIGFPNRTGFDDIAFGRLLDIEEQLPAINAPMICDPLGLGAGCCDSNWWEDWIDEDDYESDADYGDYSILPHSGQEVLDETDLVIKGRDGATVFQIIRRHTTRLNQSQSFFGPVWAFNYRHYFQQLDPNTIEMFCFGRKDVYTANGNTNEWEGGAGRFDILKWDAANLSTLRMADGREIEFHSELDGGGLLVGHLTKIISPNFNNTLEYTYDTAGVEPDLIQRKLRSVKECYGRTINFEYMDADYPDGISKIIDFSGREVVYDYNNSGQLLTVRSPVVQSTGVFGNDFPQGKTKEYTYLNHADPRLQHAITSVTYPNEFAGNGETRLEWTYNQNEGAFFGFVETHTIGNLSAPPDLAAGGQYQYSYDSGSGGGGSNDVASVVTVTDRRNTVSISEFNRTGQLLKEEIFTQGFRENEPPSYVRSFLFNQDGDMNQSVDALGTTSLRTIHETATLRTQRGNQTAKQDLADDRGGDQGFIQGETVYEPVFNKPFKVIDPRGFEAGNNPDDFTTFYIYDYMEDLAAAATYFAPRLGLSDPQDLTDLFEAAEIHLYPGVNTDINSDGSTSQNCGNLIKKDYPQVTLPSQATQIGLGLNQDAFELFVFNDFGQMTKHIDAEENVTINEYFGEDDPDGDGNIDVPGGDSSTGGYLKRTIKDALAGSGRNSGHDPTPVAQITDYQYVAQGSFPANLRGIPTAITDPRGIKHIYLVNELDQVVVEERASDVSASPEPGLTAFQYQKITKYDHNNNVVEVQIQNKDTLDPTEDDFVIYRYEFDIMDQLRREIIDEGGGNLNIENIYEYDPSLNLVRKTRGSDSPADQSVESWLYDERNILVTHTRGEGGLSSLGENSTTTYNIDLNGNIVEVVDAQGGDRTLTELDGFNRRKKVIDREGNETIYFYDSASNIVRLDQFGNLDSSTQFPPGPFQQRPNIQPVIPVLLARSHFQLDERNRLFQIDRALFHYPGKEVGQIDDGALNPGDGMVSTINIFDRLDRVVAQVDADQDLFETRFDGLSRSLRTIDPLNNESAFEYDQNNNLLMQTDTERSPNLVNDEIFISTHSYDSLNRLKTTVEPNAQTTEFDYDSRNNQISVKDQIGNVRELRYDRINRLTQTQIFLSANGEDADSSNVDATQGGGDGIITTQQTWDSLHRLRSQIDDKDQVTSYSYDLLDRKTRCDYQDGSFETWVYNKDSELKTHRNQNGSIETWSYDKASRPTMVLVDNSSASTMVKGTTRKQWGYDGLDRVVAAFDNNGLGLEDDVICEYFYDSLSRQIREKQVIGSHPTKLTDREWQGASREMSCRYPKRGRKVLYDYDALDRLTGISNQSSGSDIALFDYVGPSRDLKITYGNGAVLSKADPTDTTTINFGYDANRRHLRHTWLTSAGGSVITDYESLYNHKQGDPVGLGTNRRKAELRHHLNHRDDYSFDSSYRMIAFDRDQDLFQVGGVESSRVLDGADSMLQFVDEAAARDPLIDTLPGEEGMNQYAEFAGQARTHDDNGNLETEGLQYFYDYQNRLVEVVDPFGHSIQKNVYSSDNRRVIKKTLGLQTRYLYKDWQVIEERDLDDDSVLRQYVDGRSLDEHISVRVFNLDGSKDNFWYHANSQGFVGAMTDSQAQVQEQYEYSWLGKPRVLDDMGNKILTMYMAPADDVFFTPGSNESCIEEFTASRGFLRGELIGHEMSFVVGGETKYFTIIDNISFPNGALFTNKYTIKQDIDSAGVVDGDTFIIYDKIGVPKADLNITLYADNCDDCFSDLGTKENVVLERNPPVQHPDDSLVGELIAFDFNGVLRTFEITHNSFYLDAGMPTNEYRFRHLDLDLFIDPFTEAFSIHPRDHQADLNVYMFQGRRYDFETDLYYARNRFYSWQTGRFLQTDPAGYWHHGQGNGYAAFGEDGWNNSDPMGLSYTGNSKTESETDDKSTTAASTPLGALFGIGTNDMPYTTYSCHCEITVCVTEYSIMKMETGHMAWGMGSMSVAYPTFGLFKTHTYKNEWQKQDGLSYGNWASYDGYLKAQAGIHINQRNISKTMINGMKFGPNGGPGVMEMGVDAVADHLIEELSNKELNTEEQRIEWEKKKTEEIAAFKNQCAEHCKSLKGK